MSQTMDSNEERDLELMFAEARRYALLTAEEEQQIDGDKWRAVRALHALFASEAALREYLQQFIEHCLQAPPDIARFPNREQHFVLRRELANYYEDGAEAAQARDLVARMHRQRSDASREALVSALSIPASLTVGMAVTMLRLAGGQFSDTVADAIGQWQRTWSSPAAPMALSRDTLKALRKQLGAYTRARDKLVMHNLRLVYSISTRYKGRGVGYLDLVQEGTLGLIRAAEKFEYEKGFRFSTYCFNWITQAVRRYVGDSGAMIRFPTHVQEQIGRLYREKAEIEAKTGIEPDAACLAEQLGFGIEKTRQLMELRNLATSLDAPKFDDEDGGSVLDSLEGNPFGSADSDAANASLHRFLDSAIESLEPAEQRVIVSRWGLHDGPPLSRAEIADVLGVSREWVRQLERSALNKLRNQDGLMSVHDDYREEAMAS